MANPNPRPLITFCVMAYRQERFVREAIRSAFAQTYQPLEIILSDDCSPDQTGAIMAEEAAKYRGPHTVVLNRGASNQGLGQHINTLFNLAKGELIVLQAGDDFSRPERTSCLVDVWLAKGKPDMVVSDVTVVDENGGLIADKWGWQLVHPTNLPEAVAKGECGAIGCAAAYTRRLVANFGPLDRGVLQEDNVLPFRALLGAGVATVPEHLVSYRSHGSNLYIGTAVERPGKISRPQALRWARSRLAIMRDWQRSLAQTGHNSPENERQLADWAFLRELDMRGYERGRLDAILTTLRAFGRGISWRLVARHARRHVLRF